MIAEDAFRFEVRSGDVYAPDPLSKERSEIKVEGLTLDYAQIYDIEYRFMIEAGARNTADWVILGQLHAREDAADVAAGPILAVELQGEKLAVVGRADPAAVGTGSPIGVNIYTAPSDVVRDHWYTVKLQVMVNPLGEGLVNVWLDGKQVANYSGALGYNDERGPYWKMGIYRSAAQETLAVNYQDLTIAQADAMDGWGGRNYYTQTSGERIVGTAYTDTLHFGGQVGVTASLALTGPQDTGGQGVRTIVGVENLIGTGKNDVLEGDAGDNILGGNGGLDTVSYASATAGVTVNLTLTGPQDTGGAGRDTIRGFENITGSRYADVLIGDANANVLAGGGGDDLMRGGAGSDVYDGGGGLDTVSFSDANVGIKASLAITASQGTGFGAKTFIDVENLIGSAFNDILTGDGGDNLLRGGDGADILNGGLGANQLFGEAGDDLLCVAAGLDRLDGGAGLDTVSFANANTGVDISLARTDAQDAAGGKVTLLNIENITGSRFDDILEGGNGDNVLRGGDGNDRLIAGGSDQILDGGSGVDTVSFGRLDRGISISLSETGAQSTGAGVKTLNSIENLFGTDYADTLFGNSGANVIEAGGGDDLVLVGTGSDLLDGRSGLDTVSFDRAQAGVSISLAISDAQSTGFGAMTITRFENLVGSAYADRLTGNAGANMIHGGDGDDTLFGGGGDDVLNGGSGVDTVTFANAASGVSLSLAENGAQAIAGGSLTLVSIETLIGSGYSDVLTLGAAGGSLVGGGGSDTLIAGGGKQVIEGGAGIDTLSLANTSRGVTLSLDESGTQATAIGAITLSGIENLIGSNYDDVLSGGTGANIISGGGGDDLLVAGSGNDTLDGGAGFDVVSFADASRGVSIYLTVAGAQSTGFGSMVLTSIEGLVGSAYDDRLVGNAGANTLNGGAGKDVLDGGGGNDTLTGGSGADVFRFVAGTARDTITDFSLGEGDRVQITKGVAYSLSHVGDHTVVSFTTGEVLTLQNAHLTAADSWFTY